MKELSLHTVNSPAEADVSRPATWPYLRVAGVSLDDGQAFWELQAAASTETPVHDPADTTAYTFEVPDFVADRTVDFLLGRIVGARYPAVSELPVPDYNCHSYTGAVAENRPWLSSGWGVRFAKRFIAHAREATEDVPPLEAGEVGIIAKPAEPQQLSWWNIAKNLRGPKAQPLHSFIGLGKDQPYCLQVTDWGEWLGLGQYADVFEAYRVGDGTGQNRLYVQETASEAAAAA